MRKIIVLYDDVECVSPDINSFFKVKSYGKIFYKGRTLQEFMMETFKASNIDEVIVLSSMHDYETTISKVYYTKEQHRKNTYIYIKSNIVFENLKSFELLIEKLSLLDDDLLVNVKGNKYSLMRFGADVCMEFLTNYHKDKNFNTYSLEILNNENFLLDISHYGDFIKFLHTNFEVRYFNKIVDKEEYLIKISHNKEKIKQEYRYFQLINDELRMFFPTVFNYSEKEHEASYCIEKINVPDMAIQYVSNTLSESEFLSFLKKIRYFLEKSNITVATSDEYAKKMDKQYVSKVMERYQSLQENTSLSKKLDLFLKAGTKYDSIEAVYKLYFTSFQKKFQKVKPLLYTTFCHGDLCLSNILYDKRTQYVKLIDPKGIVENNNGYTDPYYDMAKLSHSILGCYDFINYGMFDITVDNDVELKLQIKAIDKNVAMYQRIFKSFIEGFGIDISFLRLLESSLFLSMLPLHADNEKKVLAFLLQGIHILEECSE